MAFHELKIKQVRPEGVSGVALVFDVPDKLTAEFAFKAGQYVTLRATVEGEDVRRSYSIATEPDGDLCVGVKQIAGGVFSSFAQGLQAGDCLQVMAPEGRFCLNGETDVLLVAAGSGITPMIAIAARVLADGGRVTLVYGNRDTAHIMFRTVLDRMKDRYMDRFTLIHILSREEQDVPLLNGRISGDKIRRMVKAGAIDVAAIQGAFLCGPNAMIDAVSAALSGLGMDASVIYSERFLAEGDVPTAPSREAADAAQKGVAVEVIMDGVRKSFMVQDGDVSVLDAAARAGLDLPFSCKGGMCCTCRCRIAKGTVEMAVNYSLEPWEIKAGFTLACQARPTSQKLVLDFDDM